MIIFFIVLLIASNCFADTVCIRKSDGKPIEYQSKDVDFNVLKQNAINAGLKENEIEVKSITKDEYLALVEKEVHKPERDSKANKISQSKTNIKNKLGLTDKDFESSIFLFINLFTCFHIQKRLTYSLVKKFELLSRYISTCFRSKTKNTWYFTC